MTRHRFLAAALASLFAAVASAATPLTPEQATEARNLVRQLASRSFKERELATKKLLELGKPAIPILKEAATESDAEVRRRGGELLHLAQRSDTEAALALYMDKKDDSKLMKLPSYERFGKLMGKDAEAKKLYVDMYCADGVLLAELDANPKDFAAKFQAHCQRIQQNLYTPWGQANPIPHGQIVSLLFMGCDAAASKDINSFYMINNLLYQPNVQQGFKSNAGSRKLLMAFLESRSNQQTSQQIFQIAKQMGLKEAIPMAVKMIDDKNQNITTRGMAVLFIGQMGGKEHKKVLEKLLDDKTSMGAIRTGRGTEQLTAQMRDVALASLVMAHGQSIWDYKFPFLEQYRGYKGGDLQLPPNYYGFSDDAGREAAHKKWKDSQGEAPKKK